MDFSAETLETEIASTAIANNFLIMTKIFIIIILLLASLGNDSNAPEMTLFIQIKKIKLSTLLINLNEIYKMLLTVLIPTNLIYL